MIEPNTRLGLLLLVTTLAACRAATEDGSLTSAQGSVVVHFVTERGSFDVEVEPSAAPSTASNFLRYVDGGFYTGGQFHRSVRLDNQSRSDVLIEVVQASIAADREPDEFAPIALESTEATGLLHVDGTLSMARGAPDSATSSFFVCIGAQPSLDFGGERNADGQGFAAFGRVVKGMDVILSVHGSPTDGESLAPPIRILSATRSADGASRR